MRRGRAVALESEGKGKSPAVRRPQTIGVAVVALAVRQELQNGGLAEVGPAIAEAMLARLCSSLSPW